MTFEYILVGGTLLGAIMGYIKGFLRQISSFIGLLLGYTVATLFSVQAHNFFVEKAILSPTTSLWVSFFFTIAIVLFFVIFLSRLIEKILKSLGLGFTNKIAGIVLGAFKYSVIILFIGIFLVKIDVLNSQNTSKNTLDLLNLVSFLAFK